MKTIVKILGRSIAKDDTLCLVVITLSDGSVKEIRFKPNEVTRANLHRIYLIDFVGRVEKQLVSYINKVLGEVL